MMLRLQVECHLTCTARNFLKKLITLIVEER